MSDRGGLRGVTRNSLKPDRSEADVEALERQVAGLPSEVELDGLESRLFDLTALRMQLAHAEGDDGVFEGRRKRMVEIAMLLEEKDTIPADRAQLAFLASMQETGFWDGIDLPIRLTGEVTCTLMPVT